MTRTSIGSTAAAIAAAVRAGHATAADIIDAHLDTIERSNPALNALVEVRGNDAREAARALDTRRRTGSPLGALAGVPVVVKDSIWEAGREATAGSRALVGHAPTRSAIAVERLLAADAIVIGRSNLPEFCYRGDCRNDLYGATGNPWDPSLTPGGSSGGSAAAVAAGMAPLAIGSDGGGSIRIPASFTGTFGMKPTYGLVPKSPGWPGWNDLNHLGPITRTADDLALALSVLGGRDSRDPSTATAPSRWNRTVPALGELRRLRIAYSEDLGYISVDDEVRRAFRGAIDRLRGMGLQLTETHPRTTDPLPIWDTLALADNVASEGHLLGTGLVGADAARMIRAGMSIG